ncbi:hypothetical protein HKCCA1058_04080 [Rhodobacterales bacterium HKCCA1058]|nr:hypothetical protein [Rhodobacterales bacterium HKCCA1058]
MSAVPKLRFPEFDGEWIYVTIQTLIDENTLVGHLDGNHGELYPRSEEFASFGVPYVSANDLIDGLVDLERSKRLPADRAKKFKKGIAKTGDLLFAHNATVGPVALLETDFDYVILSTTVTYFRFNEDRYSSKFALNIFQSESFVRQYSRVMSQSTRNQVPISQQRKFFIPKPTPDEQQKIASFLSSVDKKIYLLRQKKDALELYKKGLMQKIFSQEISFKQDDGRDFPNWEEVALGDVIKEIGDGGTPDTKNPDYFGGKIPWVVIEDISEKIEKTKTTITELGLRKSSAKIWPKGSLILSTGATIGRVGIAQTDVTTKQGICGIILNEGVNYKFIFYVLTWSSPWFLRMAQGNTIKEVRASTVKKMTFGLPSGEEQKKIASVLSALDAKIQNTSSQIEQMETFKKGLLQQMFV